MHSTAIQLLGSTGGLFNAAVSVFAFVILAISISRFGLTTQSDLRFFMNYSLACLAISSLAAIPAHLSRDQGLIATEISGDPLRRFFAQLEPYLAAFFLVIAILAALLTVRKWWQP